MKSRYKLSKNCGIHGKKCEISGLYNFWTSVKSNIPDVWNFWTLFGSEIEVGGMGEACSPLAPPLATPLFSIPNTDIVSRAYVELIWSWRKVCLFAIYCLFIWFNYVRIINQKKYSWFVYKFKIKFIFIVCWIRLLFASRVLAILLLAETVSVILKELRNCILCIIRVWSLFCSARVYISLHFLPDFLVKLGFRLSVF